MDIILYNTSSPPNVVEKSLGSSSWKITNVIFKDNNKLSVLEPTIVLNIGSEISKLAQYNYLKIPKFSRYYWFEVGETTGSLVEITCRVDPLMSFKDDIKDRRSGAPKQYITRTQDSKIANKMLVDNLLPMYSNHTLDILPLSEDVYTNCGHVILETVGKGGTVS